MNYLSEIVAFYNWMAGNPLPASSIALWHALMSIANGTKWANEISPSMLTLQSKAGLGKDAVIEARNRLKQAGLLEWKSRRGNQSAIYILIPFASEFPTQSPTQTPTQSPTQPPAQTPAQDPAIYKLNKTKRNCSTRTRKTSYDVAEVEAIINRPLSE